GGKAACWQEKSPRKPAAARARFLWLPELCCWRVHSSRMRLFLLKFAIFVKGFARQDDDIGETTFERIGYESSPHYGRVMPINRSPKGLFRTPRRRGCSRWIPINRNFDPAL